MPNAPKPHRPHGEQRPRDNRRHSAAERGYDWQWTKDKPRILIEMVAESADPFCIYCRERLAVTLDHAEPPTRAGAVGSEAYRRAFNRRELWIPACMRCNSDKGDMTIMELKVKRPVMWQRLMKVLRERGVVDERPG